MKSEEVILVAIQVSHDKDDVREAAMIGLAPMLPKPGLSAEGVQVECWWFAEDDRTDQSDCDSAVFVKPGKQQEAADILHKRGLTAKCNLIPDGRNNIWADEDD